MQCTKSKVKKSQEPAQHANDVDPATSWVTTMTGTHVATVALHDTSEINPIFKFSPLRYTPDDS